MKVSAVVFTALVSVAPLTALAQDSAETIDAPVSASSAFTALDKNADGKISIPEAQEVPELVKQFEEVDANKD